MVPAQPQGIGLQSEIDDLIEFCWNQNVDSKREKHSTVLQLLYDSIASKRCE